MNALIEYIGSHPNWRNELTQKPYCLTIKDNGVYTILNYNQIDSDFTNPVVRVARGIIINDIEEIVCHPFDKFANYGESYADKIDWSTARVEEKRDGSIIKVWYAEGVWHLSTNGMIDAFETDLPTPMNDCASFGSLFVIAAGNTCGSYGDFLKKIDPYKNYTLMFELTSPWNRVVVPYTDTTITYIGARNKDTDQEELLDIGIKKPESYSFATFEDILENIQTLPFSKEGYVVVDANWKRNKVKSLAYVAAHHLKNNGIISYERAYELIKRNEQEEFLSYFPEYKEVFDEVREKYQHTLREIGKAQANAYNWLLTCQTKKDFAMRVLGEDVHVRPYMFAVWDRKDMDLTDLKYERLF